MSKPDRPPRPPQSAQNVERSTIENSRSIVLRLATDQYRLRHCSIVPPGYAVDVTPTTATWTAPDGRALWNGESLHHWSNVLTSELVALFDPVEVWLFGSVARGDDGADSDLDVMIVLDRYDTADAIELKRRATVSATTPAPFDVAFSDPDRMVQRSGVVGTLERSVRLDGVLKYRRG
jgi:predicted nucleotidyltransferase